MNTAIDVSHILKTEYKKTSLSEVLTLPANELDGVSNDFASPLEKPIGESLISNSLKNGKKYVNVYSKKEGKNIDVTIDENLSVEELVDRLVALSNAVTTG